MLIKVS